MTVKEAINVRKSVRSYTQEALTEDELKTLLAAGVSAPVGMAKYENLHISVIRNKELLNELDKNAAEFFGDSSMHPLYGAPALILVSSSETNDVGSANVAMVLSSMALTAVDMGLGQVYIYGAIAGLRKNAALTAKLGLPEGFTPMAGLAVGKSDDVYESRDIPADRINISYID